MSALTNAARDPRTALVLFSGGQDSSVCLAWALSRHDHVETVGFDYGQRHAVEMEQRAVVRAAILRDFPQWAGKLGEDHVLEMRGFGQIGETAMTREREFELTEKGLPNTYVPGRNLVFLTYAAALADRRRLPALVGGMCETDYSGYPDCRPEFIAKFQSLADFATKATAAEHKKITIETPLQELSKKDIVLLGTKLGAPLQFTHSCYNGGEKACGVCDSCQLRLRGFAEAGIKDPIEYEQRE